MHDLLIFQTSCLKNKLNGAWSFVSFLSAWDEAANKDDKADPKLENHFAAENKFLSFGSL